MDRLKEKAKLLDKIIQASDGKELTPELAKTIEEALKAKQKLEELKEKHRNKK